MENFLSLASILSLSFLLLSFGASSPVLRNDSKVSPPPVPSRSGGIPPPNPNTSTRPAASSSASLSSHLSHNANRNSTSGEKEKKGDGSTSNPTDAQSKGGDKDRSTRPSKPINNNVVKEVNETCNSSYANCHCGNLIACLLHSEKDSKKLSLVIQNIGDDTSNVNITGRSDFPISVIHIAISKHISKKIDLPSDWNVTEILVDSGSNKCSIQIEAPVSDRNFLQLTTSEILLSPIYGVYLLGFTVVLLGAIWACCQFRKRWDVDGSGIPYQQIELSDQPQSSVTIISNAVDGWDEWDDDWDDEAVTKSAEKHPTTSVLSNDLTSRTPKKDGWDSAWED
ncbi:uncharacterized protein LOC122033945 [Zingiber officinale]|uniref:DUF7356 domain-containing protein n=1 Tax=Zingiber officinale TaxID=94328 RepID=A0A8J5I6Y3_ZINOF|nr:uncharacterized protein LOC122033945 [Zingiber officinale]KAG6537399.1 hypothetical protein ZIOFF_002489 [Zingiber officinale]